MPPKTRTAGGVTSKAGIDPTPTQQNGKKGPRRKTGCFACRARHLRCDETLPTCENCQRAGLGCERSSMIVFDPTPKSKNKNAMIVSSSPPKGSSYHLPISNNALFNGSNEVPFLLRKYQDGIAVWMDLFDHTSSFQRLIMRRAATCNLLQVCICALAARQLALITVMPRWKRAAAKYYGHGLRLLLEAMGQPDSRVSLTLPASVLLLSYELMSSPGQDYNRHFFGAKSLIENAGLDQIRRDPLSLAAYWVFVRQDVCVGLAQDKATMLGARHWFDAHTAADVEEDAFGNSVLIHTAKVLRLVHVKPRTDDDFAEDWEIAMSNLAYWNRRFCELFKPLELDEQGQTHWHCIPAAASARQMYLIARILLLANGPDAATDVQENRDTIRSCADEIVAISFDHVCDAVQVQAVHALFQAAKHSDDNIRKLLVTLLTELQLRTGFHTQGRVDAINNMIGHEASPT